MTLLLRTGADRNLFNSERMTENINENTQTQRNGKLRITHTHVHTYNICNHNLIRKSRYIIRDKFPPVKYCKKLYVYHITAISILKGVSKLRRYNLHRCICDTEYLWMLLLQQLVRRTRQLYVDERRNFLSKL